MFILILIFITVLLWIKKVNDNTKKLKCFVSPPGRLLLKHIHLLETKTMLPNLLNLGRKYGGLVRLTLIYGKDALLVTDKDFLSLLLSTSSALNKNEIYRHTRRWLGTGLLTSDHGQWEKQRRILTPAFRVQILEKYIQTFHKATDILLERLKDETSNENINIFPFLTLCSLDIICETAMGTKINAQEDTYSNYVSCIKEECQILVDRARSILKSIDVMYVFYQDYWNERKVLKTLHNFTKTVLSKRKQEFTKRDNSVKDKEHGRYLSFLDLLLEYSSGEDSMTDKEIAEEVDTFMFAGHDTSSTGTSFTLYCLAKYPEVQQKVYEEQQVIFGNSDRLPTYKDLHEMKYLEIVIKESMRLYPPVPIIGRQPEADIPYGDSIIPKDSSIIVFIYGLHRSPLYFENPDEFIPERFEKNIEPFTYLPFSAGARNCIGQRFAMLEMKYLITRILREYEIRCEPDFVPELLPHIVLTSVNGIMIKLIKRSK